MNAYELLESKIDDDIELPEIPLTMGTGQKADESTKTACLLIAGKPRYCEFYCYNYCKNYNYYCAN